MPIIDGIEWYQKHRERLVQEYGADFAIAINGKTSTCIVRRTAQEAQRVYERAHPKVPPTLIIVGAAL